jgi:hypothetical protein
VAIRSTRAFCIVSNSNRAVDSRRAYFDTYSGRQRKTAVTRLSPHQILASSESRNILKPLRPLPQASAPYCAPLMVTMVSRVPPLH